MKNILIATIHDETPFQGRYLVKDIESCGDMTPETLQEISNILKVPLKKVRILKRYAKQLIYESTGIKTPFHIWSIPIDELPGQLKHITDTFINDFTSISDGDYRECLTYLDTALSLIGGMRSQLFIVHEEYQEFWVRNLLPEISTLFIYFNRLTKDHPDIKGWSNRITVIYLTNILANLSTTFPGYYFSPNSEEMRLVQGLGHSYDYPDLFPETKDFYYICAYENVYCKIQ